jgi:hypothetical protein
MNLDSIKQRAAYCPALAGDETALREAVEQTNKDIDFLRGSTSALVAAWLKFKLPKNDLVTALLSARTIVAGLLAERLSQ